VKEHRRQLQETMRVPQARMRACGWGVNEREPRDNGTFYAWPNHDSRILYVGASANLTPGALRFWISLADAKARVAVAERLVTEVAPRLQNAFGRDLHLATWAVRYKTTDPAIDVRVPLQTLLKGLQAHHGVGARIETAMEIISVAALRIADGRA